MMPRVLLLKQVKDGKKFHKGLIQNMIFTFHFTLPVLLFTKYNTPAFGIDTVVQRKGVVIIYCREGAVEF